MSHITKTYWKWVSAYNTAPFSLGKRYPIEALTKNYTLIERQGERVHFHLKENKRIKITTANGLIVQKSYFGGGQVEGLFIEQTSRAAAEAFFNSYLEPCEATYEGEKLMLGCLDGRLGLVQLEY